MLKIFDYGWCSLSPLSALQLAEEEGELQELMAVQELMAEDDDDEFTVRMTHVFLICIKFFINFSLDKDSRAF